MRSSYEKPPLERVAANNININTNTANLKQFYGLRKDINALQESVEKLSTHLDKIAEGRL